MSSDQDQHQLKPTAEVINDALESGALVQVKRILKNSLASVDIAHLIESSPPRERQTLWRLIDKDDRGEILPYLSDDIATDFATEMSAQELAELTSELDSDDVADLLQGLPETLIHEVLQSMDAQNQQRVESLLGYPEDQAGGLMNTDTITVRPDLTVDVVLRYLRLHTELPEATDSLLVVNRRDEFVGILPITKMLVADPLSTVREIMNTEAIKIPAQMQDTEVAQLFELHDLISAPVVDDDNRLLGRITIDDVVDVIREDADHSLMSMAGLDEEEDTFTPALKASGRRAIWLMVNLATAFAASFFIGLFEEVLAEVVALAILMPVVASMGGVAGSQALTIVIRGMAVGHISTSNMRWLLNRELLVGLINGLLWAVVVALITFLWFNDATIALIIGAAIIINILVAAFSGTLLPPILKHFGIDPALAGGVALTTITDVVGFVSFLGLATFLFL